MIIASWYAPLVIRRWGWPSAGGISHHPDEHTEPADVERGVRVLAGTLARVAA